VGNSSPNATDPSGLVGIPGTSIDPQAGEKQRRKKGQRKDRERTEKESRKRSERSLNHILRGGLGLRKRNIEGQAFLLRTVGGVSRSTSGSGSTRRDTTLEF
jgi:hypothetical protein